MHEVICSHLYSPLQIIAPNLELDSEMHMPILGTVSANFLVEVVPISRTQICLQRDDYKLLAICADHVGQT